MTSIAFESLDWSVSKRSNAYLSNGEWVVDPYRFAIVRDDTEERLGYVSDQYEVVQNSRLYEMISAPVAEGILKVENIGSLNRGQQVFIQASFGDEFIVPGLEDKYRSYLTFLSSHVGKTMVSMGSSFVRVVCQNTFTQAKRDLSCRIRHVAGANEKIIESLEVSDFINGGIESYSQAVQKLGTRCTHTQFHEFLRQVYKKEDNSKIRNFEVLDDAFFNAPGQSGETWYDAFNAVTFYSSHRSRKTDLGCFNYVNFGTGTQINSRALEVAQEMAAV